MLLLKVNAFNILSLGNVEAKFDYRIPQNMKGIIRRVANLPSLSDKKLDVTEEEYKRMLDRHRKKRIIKEVNELYMCIVIFARMSF